MTISVALNNRTVRDMTKREFRAALRRHGWGQALMWITGTDKQGHTVGVGFVLRKKGSRGWMVDRRASLAKAIHELKSNDNNEA